MKCSEFSAEQYAMFAIGCLEPEEAVNVSSHLASDCETCWLETRRSIQFWTVFGSGLSGEPDIAVQAPRGLILPFERRTRRPAQPSWYRWGALAAALALITAASIFLVERGPGKRAVPPLAVVQNTAELQTLRDRVDDLTRQRDELARAAQAQPPPRNPTANDAALRQALGQRQAELAQLRQTLDATTSELQRNRSETTVLQAQLTNQQQQLQAAIQQQNDAKAQSAAAAAAQRGAEEQVRTLSAQVQQLNRERTQLLEDVQTRQRQISQNLQLTNLLSTPGTRFISVVGSEDAPQSHGYALLSPGHRLQFFATNLPALPNGREYQLWLLRSRNPGVVSAGVFRATSNGTGSVEFTNPALATDIASIAVTDEPAGGSKLPTGHKLLIGVVRS